MEDENRNIATEAENPEAEARRELDRLKAEIKARRLLSEAELPEEALALLDTGDPDALESRVAALKQLVSREAARLCEKRLAGMAPSPLAVAVDYDDLSDREYYALKR